MIMEMGAKPEVFEKLEIRPGDNYKLVGDEKTLLIDGLDDPAVIELVDAADLFLAARKYGSTGEEFLVKLAQARDRLPERVLKQLSANRSQLVVPR